MTTKTTASLVLALILTALVFTSTAADARSHGRCDGYHGCRCGVTAANYNGVSLTYNGFNLKQAIEWVRAFPRTSFGSGVVAYMRGRGPTGHVATVVGGSDCSHAQVHDENGTYTRNVCSATFVAVRSGGAVYAQHVPRTRHVRSRQGTQRAYAMALPDRNGAN